MAEKSKAELVMQGNKFTSYNKETKESVPSSALKGAYLNKVAGKNGDFYTLSIKMGDDSYLQTFMNKPISEEEKKAIAEARAPFRK